MIGRSRSFRFNIGRSWSSRFDDRTVSVFPSRASENGNRAIDRRPPRGSAGAAGGVQSHRDGGGAPPGHQHYLLRGVLHRRYHGRGTSHLCHARGRCAPPAGAPALHVCRAPHLGAALRSITALKPYQALRLRRPRRRPGNPGRPLGKAGDPRSPPGEGRGTPVAPWGRPRNPVRPLGKASWPPLARPLTMALTGALACCRRWWHRCPPRRTGSSPREST
eukprot:1190347-Prorocentrum_minimum.AAC.1